MHYVGVDYHKKSSYVTVMDERGKVVKEGQIANTQEALAALLDGSAEGASAVLEAGRNWPVMYDWLEELVDEVTLAHPAKVRVIAEAKVKTDRIDSRMLAHLLRADLIPAAYVPGAVTREQRRRLRQRMFPVGLSTMVKNRIHTLIDRHPQLSPEAGSWSDLFGKAGRAWLQRLELPPSEAQILRTDLALLGALEQHIKQSNRWVSQLAKGDERAKLLVTLPGIGDFFAVLLAVEIDDVRRFLRAEKLCAYAGLVPSTYASGGYVYHGRITKQGNKWIRWACIEAVYPAIRQDPDLAALYGRLKATKGANVAKVAVAKRLLTIVYRLLTERRPYRPATDQPALRKRNSPAALTAV
ncbi:MAG TPA: IS110 family transposase [Armatimonadota bacterium]|nr:IS110 family transposase [Armatimonadota bacterium]